MKFWIYVILALTLAGAIGSAKYLYDQNQKLKTEKAILEARNEEVVKEGNRYANRPRTGNERTLRLCKWIEHLERQDKGKPKRGVPARVCP